MPARKSRSLTINTDAMTDFLVGLLNTPSPTGYAVEAIEYVRKAFERLKIPSLAISLTTKGALLPANPSAPER